MNAKRLPWIVTGVSVIVLGGILLWQRMAHAATHPDPRANVTAATVLPPASVATSDEAMRAYQAAALVPQVLDGLYCHCRCKDHLAHRSLLTCFESDHGANCDICMGEAILAARMHAQGASLDAIRRAVDAQFRRTVART